MHTTTDTAAPPLRYFLRTGPPPPAAARLAAQVQRARMQEREHLARELHDVLNGEIVAARLQLAGLQARVGGLSPDVDRRLEALDRHLLAALALKRSILDGLDPQPLRGLGLATSLRAMAREFAANSGVRVEVDLQELRADEGTQLAIYRLVQESLSNMAKHAGASEAAIVLREQAGEVCVEVRDNGAGFDTRRAGAAGRGLQGMRERIEGAGGRLALESGPGQGTRIRAWLPRHAARTAS